MRRISMASLRQAGRLAAAMLLGGALTGPALAQSSFSAPQRQEIIEIIRDAMRKDPSILRDAVTALQQDEAHQQENAAGEMIAALGPALTQNAADPIAGNPKGDVTLVEFFDVRCPYCRRMVSVVDELIKREPNLRIVYKDLPVLGPGSVAGARALLAAQKQGGYLKLPTLLMAANTFAMLLVSGTIAGGHMKFGPELFWFRSAAYFCVPETEPCHIFTP